MFKRVRWVSVGAVLGAGGSVYAQRKVRRTAQRYLPPEVGSRVVDRARRLGQEVHDAVAEGRAAMAEREAELRARVEPPAPPARRPYRDATARSIDRPPPERADGARGRTRRDGSSRRR